MDFFLYLFITIRNKRRVLELELFHLSGLLLLFLPLQLLNPLLSSNLTIMPSTSSSTSSSSVLTSSTSPGLKARMRKVLSKYKYKTSSPYKNENTYQQQNTCQNNTLPSIPISTVTSNSNANESLESLISSEDKDINVDEIDVDICINGGGPVGLFAAYLFLYQNRQLHQNQHFVRRLHTVYPVIEREDEDDEEDSINELKCEESFEEEDNKADQSESKTLHKNEKDFIDRKGKHTRLNQKSMNWMTMNQNLFDIPVLTNKSIRIFDKNPSRTNLSKALVLQSRTLELLYSCGLYSRFEPYFDRNAVLECHFFNLSPTLKVKVNAGLEHKSVIPYMAVIPQSETERILEEALWEEFGVKVERNMEMTDFVVESEINNLKKQKEISGVKCTYCKLQDFHVETKEKKKCLPSKLVVHAKFVLGCDGAHSFLRKRLGIEFEGEQIEGIFSMADVNLLVRENIENSLPITTFLETIENEEQKQEQKGEGEQESKEDRSIFDESKQNNNEKKELQEFVMKREGKALTPYNVSKSGSCLEIFLGFQGIAALFHMPKHGYSRIIVPNLEDFSSTKNSSSEDKTEKDPILIKVDKKISNHRNPTITNALSEQRQNDLYSNIHSFLKRHDNSFLSTNLEITDPTWITCFKIQERLASCYHNAKDSKPAEMAKRVFLCGDAAHVHSPLGGQGMNMGLGDVWNLTWKINYALYFLNNRNNKYIRPLISSEEEINRSSPFFGLTSSDTNNLQTVIDELLASYSIERRQVAQTILEGTTNGTKFIMYLTRLRIFIERQKKKSNFFFLFFFELFLRVLHMLLLYAVPFIFSPIIASSFSQLDIEYLSNCEEGSKKRKKSYLSAGQRVNTVGIVIKRNDKVGSQSIQRVSILRYLDTIHHLIVVFTECKRDATFTEKDFLEIANFPKVYARKMLFLDPNKQYSRNSSGEPLSFDGTYLCGSAATIISNRNEVLALRRIFGLPIHLNFLRQPKKRKPCPTFQPKQDNFSHEDIPFFFIIRPDGHLAYTNCIS